MRFAKSWGDLSKVSGNHFSHEPRAWFTACRWRERRFRDVDRPFAKFGAGSLEWLLTAKKVSGIEKSLATYRINAFVTVS